MAIKFWWTLIVDSNLIRNLVIFHHTSSYTLAIIFYLLVTFEDSFVCVFNTENRINMLLMNTLLLVSGKPKPITPMLILQKKPKPNSWEFAKVFERWVIPWGGAITTENCLQGSIFQSRNHLLEKLHNTYIHKLKSVV